MLTVLDFLHNKFVENDLSLPNGMSIDTLIELVKLCCKNTVFSFNHKFYEQIEGCPMGSPLSVILANLIMEFIEVDLMNLFPATPAFYKRYVDDTCGIWQHSMDDFNAFFNGMNELLPSIKFTVEWEGINPTSGYPCLAFLDVMIHRTSNGPKYAVYRKPTHTHSYINYFSAHAPSQKRGSVFGQALRAFRVCSPEFLKQELDVIYSAFNSLGYPTFVIRGIISEARTKFLSTDSVGRSTTPDTGFTTLRFPFHDELDSLNASIRNSKHRIVFTSSNTTGRAVVSKRGTQVASTYHRSGVYTIDCLDTDCQMTYFGRSMDLKSRITKHKTDYRTNLESSALVKHAQDFPGHGFNPGNARLIWSTRDVYQTQLLEAACIKLFPSCNRGPGDVTVSQTFASVCMYLVGFKGSTGSSSHTASSPPVNSVDTDPVQQLRVPSADVQGRDHVISSIRSVPITPGIISNRQVDPFAQQPPVGNSVNNVAASQPLPARVISIIQDEVSPASQPVGIVDILNSPRRTRSEGLVNVYTMTHNRRGYERT